MTYADLPFSFILVGLGRFESPLLVFGVLGRLWWLLLGGIASSIYLVVNKHANLDEVDSNDSD